MAKDKAKYLTVMMAQRKTISGSHRIDTYDCFSQFYKFLSLCFVAKGKKKINYSKVLDQQNFAL